MKILETFEETDRNLERLQHVQRVLKTDSYWSLITNQVVWISKHVFFSPCYYTIKFSIYWQLPQTTNQNWLWIPKYVDAVLMLLWNRFYYYFSFFPWQNWEVENLIFLSTVGAKQNRFQTSSLALSLCTTMLVLPHELLFTLI